ncbi:MAG: hypothetical protein CL759_10730, partial [Chloroflexi bacterium]|nr:hypothetical protein [Chloroflexota bacterium]
MNSQADRQVYVSVDEPFTGGILRDILGPAPGASAEDWLETVAKAALEVALEETGAAQMSLFITDDQTVRGLNSR